MRVALHHTSAVGVRAGRILLGERRLEKLGLVDREPRREADERIVEAVDLIDWDVLVTDDPDPEHMIEEALEAGIDCVVWADAKAVPDDAGDRFAGALRTLVVGANLAGGLAPALASHETARVDEVLEITIAWTEPGSPLRKGEAIPFPDPIGARWAAERPMPDVRRAYVAPVTGEWAGAMVRVTGAAPDGVVTRVVGVADLAEHLEALALAAGAIVAATDGYPVGLQHPAAAGEAYLTSALLAGLDVAAYQLDGV